jgi:hypothetical protein
MDEQDRILSSCGPEKIQALVRGATGHIRNVAQYLDGRPDLRGELAADEERNKVSHRSTEHRHAR